MRGHASNHPLLDAHHTLVRLPRVAQIASAFAELAPHPRTVLDVGAGDGRVGRAYADRIGAHVEGVDVAPQPGAALDVRPYDGTHLPYPDAAFDAVLLADVLHHADEPDVVLREALRVAAGTVLVKDHFGFGPISRALLLLMDRVGNHAQGVRVRGSYASPAEWTDRVHRAGGHVEALIWPLHVHAVPIRWLTRSELQFAARIRRRETP